MNFSFLPTKIKDEIKKIIADKIPVSLARSSTSIDGETGESYVIAYEDKLLVFSRKLGESSYTHVAGDLGKDVGSVKIRKEGVNTFLDTDLLGKKYSLKFSSFEEKSLTPIVEQWQKASGGAPAAETTPKYADAANKTETMPPSAPDQELVAGELNNYTGLAAALMFVAAVDDEVSPEEDKYIIRCFNNNQKLLKTALEYYKTHSFEELLVALSAMSQDQKLCFLANFMDLGMADGVLHRSEMKIIRQFCDYMDITEDEYATIKQVLLIKNQLSVL